MAGLAAASLWCRVHGVRLSQSQNRSEAGAAASRRENKMTKMVIKATLAVAEPLVRFIEAQALPGTEIEPAAFWSGLAAIYAELESENAALLWRRDRLEAAMDAWHQARAGQPI